MEKIKKKKKAKQLRKPSGMERTERFGNIELRYKNAELDEIIVRDESGKCIFHMEWMHDNNFWMRLSGTKKDIDIDFGSESKIKFKVRSENLNL